MTASTQLHPFDDGFLSQAARELRAAVRDRYPSHVELAYEVNRHAVRLQHDLEIHHGRLHEALGAALYARTIAFTQSSVLMLEHGMPVQAKTLLRSGLETLFQLAALAQDTSVGPELVASHDADRKTLVDRMQRWQDPALRASIRSKVSEADFASMSNGPGRPTNVYELAKRANMEDWYLTVYTLLSFAAHSKISDLSRHVVVDDNGEPTEFQNEPELTDQESVWSWIIEVKLLAMRSVAIIFSLGNHSTDLLRERLKQLGDLV